MMKKKSFQYYVVRKWILKKFRGQKVDSKSLIPHLNSPLPAIYDLLQKASFLASIVTSSEYKYSIRSRFSTSILGFSIEMSFHNSLVFHCGFLVGFLSELLNKVPCTPIACLFSTVLLVLEQILVYDRKEVCISE